MPVIHTVDGQSIFANSEEVDELSGRMQPCSERRTELFLFRFEWYQAEYERDDGGYDEDDERHVL